MKVLGIQEMKGVSKKTGKPYDSVVLYVTGEAKDVVGCITDNIWVPRDVWDSQVGEQFRDEASLSELVVFFFSAAVNSTCSVSPLFAGGPLFPIGKKAPFVKGR